MENDVGGGEGEAVSNPHKHTTSSLLIMATTFPTFKWDILKSAALYSLYACALLSFCIYSDPIHDLV